MTVDEVNEKLQFERDIEGFRLTFRGYIGSKDNNLLVGMCLAWPRPNNKDSINYCCFCGTSEVIPYKSGQTIEGWYKVPTTLDSTPEYLVECMKSSLQTLEGYINARSSIS